jgi:hypothetical protein
MKTRSDQYLAEDKARRDYEYEARRRLYSEFEPLQFRMVELCEIAYERSLSPVGGMRSGRIDNQYATTWPSDPYAMLATVYELMAPLALFKIARAKLTLSDLNLDATIKRQYLLSRELYLLWQSGTELAAASPSIEYDDSDYDGRQVPLGRHLDELLSALVTDVRDRAELIEFRDYYKRAEANQIPELAHLTTPLTTFNPASKRVLWRAFVASAHICRAIIDYSDSNPPHPAEALPATDLPAFQWTSSDGRCNADDDLAAVRHYLRVRFQGWKDLAPSSSPAVSRRRRARR